MRALVRKHRNTALAILILLSLARLATYWRFTEPPFLASNDFSPDYVSAREWMSGEDPYAPLGALYAEHLGPVRLVVEDDQLNPHPPILIVLAAPLARLDIKPARVLVMLLTLAAILAAVLMLCRELGMTRAGAGAVAAGVLMLPLVEFEVRWAQTNGLIMFALVLGWWSLRRGSERRAGIALGLAAAIKIYPWIMVVPLIRRRRWSAAVWMTGTAAVATLGGLLALGPAATLRFATEASSRNVEAWGAAPNAISLISLPFRLFASGRWLHPDVSVPGWIAVAGMVMLGLCLAAAWRTAGTVTGDLMWATVPWMVLASPIAWPHYLVTTIPVCIVVAVRSGTLRPPARVPALMSVGVIVLLSPFVEWYPRLDYAVMVLGSCGIMLALGYVAALDFRVGSRWGAGESRTAVPSRS